MSATVGWRAHANRQSSLPLSSSLPLLSSSPPLPLPLLLPLLLPLSLPLLSSSSPVAAPVQRGSVACSASSQGPLMSATELLGAELLGAELLGAELLGAELLGAELLGAELLGAELLGAELLGAELPVVLSVVVAIVFPAVVPVVLVAAAGETDAIVADTEGVVAELDGTLAALLTVTGAMFELGGLNSAAEAGTAKPTAARPAAVQMNDLFMCAPRVGCRGGHSIGGTRGQVHFGTTTRSGDVWYRMVDPRVIRRRVGNLRR